MIAADGTRLHGRRWLPATTPVADVVLVHGAFEHLGRYEHVARRLTEAGFRVTGVDFRGHGLSGGRRGHVKRWRDYLEDLRTASSAVDAPYFLVSHSMGGLVALEHLRTATGARAIAASAPLLGLPERLPTIKLRAARVLSRLLPTTRFDNALEPSRLCSDPAVVEAYGSDPLVFGTVTARWSTEMLAAIDRVSNAPEDCTKPLLCLYGEDDRVVDTESIERFVSASAGESEVQSWPGLRHEIFNEPIRDVVIDRVVKWLRRQATDIPSR